MTIWTGTGTTIVIPPSGAVGDIQYGYASPQTILSLARYAQIMNLDPLHFFGGTTALKTQGACDDVWYEYSWQDGTKVSRQEILLQIARAEEEIAEFLGFLPGPCWIEDEEHKYPQFFDRNYRGATGRSQGNWNYKSIKLNYGHVHYGGTRADQFINTSTRGADVDANGDTYSELAMWTITGVDFDPDEIHAYFKEYAALDAENCRIDPESEGADPTWEIRDIRVTYNSATQTAIVYIPRWQLFKPQLQHAINASPIDADDSDSYVDDIIFYRVYNDASDQVSFLWTSEESCADTACAWAYQDGCMQLSDKRQGIALLTPGTYDSTTDSYTAACFSQNVEPHKVLISYYSGFIDPRARGVDKLSTFFAHQIAKLATSRIPKRFCYCENIQLMVNYWQEDTMKTDDARSFIVTETEHPFGTRVGELEVYRALKRYGLKVKSAINTYL